MGRRWIQKEEEALAEVRRRLKDELANRPQFPEVVGDRRILRFIRGKNWDVDVATKMYSDMLKWRDENNVDEVRQQIVYGGVDTPFKFPLGKCIIGIAPQIILSANSLDHKGRPLAMEMFDFSPKEVLDNISIKDYLVFLTYSLEYRALILEEMSHNREQEYLAAHPDPETREDGYGVILLDMTIRDLKGIGLGHLGSRGRALVAAALELGLPNYQEYLGKCHMINTPWVFNTFWYFIKGFLDEDTIAKIGMCGSNYMPVLLEDMPYEAIPERLGGGFKPYNEPYMFDTSVKGPLYYEGAPIPGIYGNMTKATADKQGEAVHEAGRIRRPSSGSGNGISPDDEDDDLQITILPYTTTGKCSSSSISNTPVSSSSSSNNIGGGHATPAAGRVGKSKSAKFSSATLTYNQQHQQQQQQQQQKSKSGISSTRFPSFRSKSAKSSSTAKMNCGIAYIPASGTSPTNPTGEVWHSSENYYGENYDDVDKNNNSNSSNGSNDSAAGNDASSPPPPVREITRNYSDVSDITIATTTSTIAELKSRGRGITAGRGGGGGNHYPMDDLHSVSSENNTDSAAGGTSGDSLGIGQKRNETGERTDPAAHNDIGQSHEGGKGGGTRKTTTGIALPWRSSTEKSNKSNSSNGAIMNTTSSRSNPPNNNVSSSKEEALPTGSNQVTLGDPHSRDSFRLWTEYREFVALLYTMVTEFPVHTSCLVALTCLLLYYRTQGVLHLLVVPFLLAVTVVYFELF